MAVFQLGPIIKSRREELNLTQEELSDGICSVPTLSRIENGERLPTKNHFEMLLQRLGYSEMFCDCYIDKREFRIHKLKFKIRQAYVINNFELASSFLKEFEELLEEKTQIDKQFLTLYKILLNEPAYSEEAKLALFEEALQLTCPNYKSNRIPHVLSYEEIILLNNIAICNDNIGNRSQAISILYAVNDYYNKHIVGAEEALRTRLMILYNLSKYLGQDGRFDECIEICDTALDISRNTGRCQYFDITLFNKAWACINRGYPNDKETAKEALKHAYYFSNTLGKNAESDFYKNYYFEVFGEALSE